MSGSNLILPGRDLSPSRLYLSPSLSTSPPLMYVRKCNVTCDVAYMLHMFLHPPQSGPDTRRETDLRNRYY
jgi:hypothetical protein